ncbi:Bug family tripartite tricarboxylate transporter substrate binding protein [Roseomonas chloroacetimidivorans]|uniref:Bug family tripartite tricarboxylate transporter substrate binding protein n=1 Tax=Roseomonas chloroacetimidivorans TaxID=1766656 RepID=UPI003C78FBC5
MSPFRPDRRHLLGAGGAALGAAGRTTAQPGAAGPPWPTRIPRFIVPFAPGGPVEVPARFIAEHLTRRLGQPFIVEPRPGAGGALGVQAVLQAGDGHSFVFTTSSVATLPALQRNPGFDPLRDLLPVTLVLEVPLALVSRPDWPVRDFDALLKRARAGRRPSPSPPPVSGPPRTSLGSC